MTPRRPDCVPARAKWVEADSLWILGRREGIFSYGLQRLFRPDGSVYGVENHDEFGSLDGVREYFHSDGSLANRQVWKSFHDENRGPLKLTDEWVRSAECTKKYPTCVCWQLDGAPRKIWRWAVVDRARS